MTRLEDYLERFASVLPVAEIAALRRAGVERAHGESHAPFEQAVRRAPAVVARHKCYDGAVVEIGHESELTEADGRRLDEALATFVPWKKGPYRIFGREIDAEWRSDMKWARLLPEMSPLKGRKVADIGCHNGYFLFRMAAQSPELVIGFEPVGRHYWNFKLLQNFAHEPALVFEPFGVEHLDLYRDFFDTVFCLGILYHHTDPVGILRKILASLRSKGELLVECQGIAGEEPIALTPRGRYARARGIWHLPTASCLETWMARAGFTGVRTFWAKPLSTEEQRTTPWAPVESLQDFLDPADPRRTVEGYPAPWRIYTIGYKP